jgi:D-alanyl-D-alanine carboxypeptidase
MLSYSRIRPRHVLSVLFLVTAVVVALICTALTAAARPQAIPAPAQTAHAVTTHATTTHATTQATVSGPIGVTDGIVPGGVTVFDDQYAAISNLDPALLSALRDAADASGRPFYVSSGWRSVRYQQQLLDEAIAKYGSAEEAARWVAPPALSEHVAGKAVDIANSDAQSWLLTQGAAYGLCRIYTNEPWHFELRPAAEYAGCPAMYADAAHDPRFQQ